MNAKERFYSGLAKETLGKITSNKDNWTSFLVTVSRNYEFTYPEQVMIYAQRPNATFCKPYDEWNDENYRRYVRRGSTGIALFVTNREKPYLRYVFDVADTGGVVFLLEHFAELVILNEVVREILLAGIPAGAPVEDHANASAVGIYFLSH